MESHVVKFFFYFCGHLNWWHVKTIFEKLLVNNFWHWLTSILRWSINWHRTLTMLHWQCFIFSFFIFWIFSNLPHHNHTLPQPYHTTTVPHHYHTGQSLSLKVTVTFKLRDETIVIFGWWFWVSMYKGNYDSFCLYWLGVSKYKRNHIENEVVMVATESQSIFTWSMAISKVLMKYESYKMTHI